MRSALCYRLLIGLALVAASCGPSSTPTVAPSAIVPTMAPATATSAPTQPPSTSTSLPIIVPTLPATPPAAETVPPVLAAVECEAGQPWQTAQEDLILVLCFNPYPPQLGTPVTYEAYLTDAAGQPLTEASVELALVGGMAGMLGEHDEEFVQQLDGQEPGRYLTKATIGSADLVLTGVNVTIRSGRQVWSFSISADELQP